MSDWDLLFAFSEEELDLLLLLVKKKSSKYIGWYHDFKALSSLTEGFEYNDYATEKYLCNICDKKIISSKELIAHGKCHLKESKLLAFI